MESQSLSLKATRRLGGGWEPSARHRRLLETAAAAGWGKLLGLVLPLLLLGAWEATTRLELVSPQLLMPLDVLRATFLDMVRSGELAENLGMSLLRVGAGFLLGASAGLFLGAAMGLSVTLREYLEPLVDAVRQVPLVGWLPLLILLLGIDESFKIVFIAIGAFVPMVVKTLEGVQGVPASYLEVARVLECGRLKALRRVILPAAMPAIFTGLRSSLSEAWMLVVGAELVAATEGLGYMMTIARTLFQTDVVLVGVVVIAAMGFLMDWLLAAAEARLLGWRRTFNAG